MRSLDRSFAISAVRSLGAVAVSVALFAFGCGGVGGPSLDADDGGGGGGNGSDASSGDASRDSATGDARRADGSSSGDANTKDVDLTGTFKCDAITCGPGEYCIHPCAGGVLPICDVMPSGGTCPGNLIVGNCRGDSGPTMGCVDPPPPAFCSPKLECPNAVPAVLEGGGRNVSCLCA